MICLSYTYDENVDIYGTYDFKEENDKVVSVQLNAFYEGESFMVAEITDIVVEQKTVPKNYYIGRRSKSYFRNQRKNFDRQI